jgi:hypothetical protein
MGDSIKQPQHVSEDLSVPEDDSAAIRGGEKSVPLPQDDKYAAPGSKE